MSSSLTTLQESRSFFVTGGTLSTSASSYVVRQADTDLYNALRAGEFCYVLNSRQMGKSSLMVRTAERLKAEGITVAVLDLTSVGQNLSPEQWYDGLLSKLAQQFDLEDECEEFYTDHARISPLQRFMEAVQKVALPRSQKRLVICVDEIDVVRSLPFSADEFFAAIRQCYVGRATDPQLERLTFCLLGSATPADLIQDTRTSPFNIGKRIEVQDFTQAEAAPLAQGLGKNGPALLARVLYWTGGHPYLTQRLCRSVAEAGATTDADVDRVCTELFLTHAARDSDDNLAFVRNRLLKSEADLASLLDLYTQMRAGKRVPDDETNLLCSLLKLSGVCRVEKGLLKVRNRIYQHVFDRQWVLAHMPDAETRRQRRAYRRGVMRTTAVASAVVGAMAALTFFALRQRDRAETATRKAEQAAANVAAEKRVTERLNYLANMSLLAQAYRGNRPDQVAELLSDTAQSPFRGFEWLYWKRIAERGAVALTAPPGTFVTGTFSTDGRAIHLLQLSPKGMTVGVRDASSGKAGFNIPGQFSFAYASPTGRTVATGYGAGKPGPMQVWDIGLGKLLRTVPGRFGSAIISDNGQVAVTTTRPFDLQAFDNDLHARVGEISLWHLPSGQKVATLRGEQEVKALSPDGSTVVTAMARSGKDCMVTTWDTLLGHRLASWIEPSGNVNLSISRNGRLGSTAPARTSASGIAAGPLWLRDLRSGRRLAALESGSLAEIPVPPVFSPDGRQVVAVQGGSQPRVGLWDTRTGRRVEGNRWPAGLPRTVASSGCSFAYSDDGRFLLLADIVKRQVTIVDLTTGKRTGQWNVAGANACWMAPNGSRFVTSGIDGLLIYDARNQKKGEEFVARVADRAYGSRFLTDDGLLLAFNADGMTVVRDLASGRVLRTLGRADIGAASPDGSRVALCWTNRSAPGTPKATPNPPAKQAPGPAKIWDVRTGRILHTLSGARQPIGVIEWSPDGHYIVTRSPADIGGNGADKGELCIWDAESGSLLHLLPNQPGILTFSQDGRRLGIQDSNTTFSCIDLATGRSLYTTPKGATFQEGTFLGGDRLLLLSYRASEKEQLHSRVLELPGGRELYTLTDFPPVIGVVASPDGNAVLTVGLGAQLFLLDSATGRRLFAYNHAREMAYPSFTPDGRRIAILSSQGCTFLDVETGRETLTLPARDKTAQQVYFSPHGRMMYRFNSRANGARSDLQVWDLRPHTQD